MKRVLFFCMCIMVSGVLMFSCKPDDITLHTQIQAALAEAPAGITTDVRNRVVTIEGTVDSEEMKTKIGETVSSVKNVKSVVNSLVVRTPEPVVNPDDALKEVITVALTKGGYKDVVVSVVSGEVTLTGTAKKDELKKVEQLVNDAKPTKVINQIKTK